MRRRNKAFLLTAELKQSFRTLYNTDGDTEHKTSLKKVKTRPSVCEIPFLINWTDWVIYEKRTHFSSDEITNVSIPPLPNRRFSISCNTVHKIKFTVEQATKTQRRGRGVALLFL